MHQVERIHFVGIGGAGMSGIAEVLRNLGYQVSGSDVNPNRMTRHLETIGVQIFDAHDADNVIGADVVVYSSAVDQDNSELQAAVAARIPIVPRAEMLAELMRFRRGIAVAGTHGKTTTTSLVASALAQGGLDPTFVIGGLVHAFDSHARLGEGNYLVCEADESDASFLRLSPLISVLTNIDVDHMDTYDGDFAKLQSSFVEFFKRLPFYGVAIVCIDDPNAAAIIPEIHTRVVTYGFSEQADIRALDVKPHGVRSKFRLTIDGEEQRTDFILNMPGRHNVLNSLAAVAVARELGVGIDDVAAAFASFQGIGRRCQFRGNAVVNNKRVAVIDDYAHHPSEIAVTCQAVRDGWPDRRLLVAFQPHRYTRTRDLFEDFVETLSVADAAVILDIYPAGEDPIPGADARALCRAIRLRGKIDPLFAPGSSELMEIIGEVAEPNDVVLILGAGNIGRVVDTFDFEPNGSNVTTMEARQ